MGSLEEHSFAFLFAQPGEAAGGAAFNASAEVDTNPAAHLVRAATGVFTPDECRRIVEIGDAWAKSAARVEEHPERWRQYRAGDIAWLAPREDTRWIYERFAVLFADANDAYGFEILGMLDAPQYTVYGGGHHFDWHIDVGAGAASLRKLSMSVQLTDGADYRGGDLVFPWGGELEGQRELGAVIVFPSFLAHRVSPVEAGVRRSLVAWACGPTFR